MKELQNLDVQRRRLLMGMGVAGVALAGSALSCSAMAAARRKLPKRRAATRPKTATISTVCTRPGSSPRARRPACWFRSTYWPAIAKTVERLFRTLNERIAFLMKGGPVAQVDPKLPPPDSGILGPIVNPGQPDHHRLGRRIAVRRTLRSGRRQTEAACNAWSAFPTMRWRPIAVTAT
nr:hypothetical protein [Pseudomonas moraviensis]